MSWDFTNLKLENIFGKVNTLAKAVYQDEWFES